MPGGGASSPALLCVDNTSTNSGNGGLHSTAVYCAAPNGTAGPNAPYSWATIGGHRDDGVVSRAQRAIVLDHLHAMELRRRVAVADHRFRKDARASAYTRYLAARYIIEANQRRAENGGSAGGTVLDCNTTRAVPDGLAEICGLRISVDAKLRSLDQGESFYGYAKLFTPPASIPVASWVKGSGDEVAAAQSAIDTWSTQARVRYGSQDSAGQWDLTLEAAVAALEQTLSPGGDGAEPGHPGQLHHPAAGLPPDGQHADRACLRRSLAPRPLP
jgi:hypothetical protein